MADIADVAGDNIERELEMRIKSLKPVDSPVANGECLNCYEPLSNRRWCDSTCRDDWQARTKKDREIDAMNRSILGDD